MKKITIKKRAILSIVVTLLTGFIIGYISSNQIRHFKTRDVRSMSSSHSFRDRSFTIIQPSEEQIELLSPLVDEYAIRFDSLKKSVSGIYKSFIEEYHQEIYPYLEEDQIARMQEFGKHVRRNSKTRDKKKNCDH